MSIPDVQIERSINVKKLLKLFGKLHPIVLDSLQKNRKGKCYLASKGSLPHFMVEDVFLVAREHFEANEKLCLCWRGPRRVVKAINDYFYEVEDLRNRLTDEVHVPKLKF